MTKIEEHSSLQLSPKSGLTRGMLYILIVLLVSSPTISFVSYLSDNEGSFSCIEYSDEGEEQEEKEESEEKEEVDDKEEKVMDMDAAAMADGIHSNLHLKAFSRYSYLIYFQDVPTPPPDQVNNFFC